MTTSVIVPFQANKGPSNVYFKRLKYCLQAIACQDAPYFKRILVDYCSDPDLLTELARLSLEFGFKLVHCGPPQGMMSKYGRMWNRARALNAGAREIEYGGLLLFVDADCVLAPGYVRAHEEAHSKAMSEGKHIATFSFVTDTTEKVVPDSFEEIERQGEKAFVGPRKMGFSHIGLQRDWLLINGFMDERYVGWGAEDDELWRRLLRSGVERLEVKCKTKSGSSIFHLWHPQWTTQNKLGEKLVKRNRRIFRFSYVVKYGMLTIDPQGAVNLGNRLIEHAVCEVLGLGAPAVRVSMFRPIGPKEVRALNECAFVLAPGSTILADARGNSEAMGYLSKLKVPVFAFGASGWGPKHPPHIRAIKTLAQPIGCRDPQILSVCRANKVKARFVGCPTFLLPYLPAKAEHSYWVAGFSRSDLPRQLEVYRSFQSKRASNLKVRAAVQEIKHETPTALALGGEVFDYAKPAEVIKAYRGSEFVVTGRLHGILPAMSQRRHVWFFGDPEDSRFTLLTYMGIKIHRLDELLSDEVFFQGPEIYNKFANEFRQSVLDWKSETIDRLA